MARCKALILAALLIPTHAYGGVLRATYPPFDWSFSPSTRIPQYWLVDAPGDLVVGDVADGDQAYVASTDQMMVRRNGAWVELLNSATTLPSGWQDDGTNIRLITNSDTVSIGSTSPTAGMKLSVSSHIGGTVDQGSNLGSASFRFNDLWVTRVLVGSNATSGLGLVTTALETVGPVSYSSEVANDSSSILGNVLVRRSRGSLASKTAVATGDFLAAFEVQPDPAGGGGYVQGAGILWDVESRTAANAIGVRERHLTRGTAGGAAQTDRFWITANGNIVIGDQGAALGTGATDGFFYPKATAGVPAGTPTAYTGSIPLAYDSTNGNQYMFTGGVWKIMNPSTQTCTNQFARSQNGSGTWTCASVALATDLSTFTSADLRGRLTDEVGTGAAIFGVTTTMNDDISAAGNCVLQRNSGDSAWQCTSGIGVGLPRVARVTADVSSTSASFADVTGLTQAVAASTSYSFSCELAHVTAVNTTALQVSINGPASPTAMRYCVTTATTNAAPFFACENAYDANTNPVTGAAAVSLPVRIAGTVENGGNSGTLAIRLRTEVAASSVTIQRGSYCTFYQH